MPAPPVNSDAHRKLLGMMLRRMRAAEERMWPRYEKWRRSERTYRLYVNPDELQEPVEPVTEESELLFVYPASIVVPLSYALTQTLISFWITLLTENKPYVRIDPASPDSWGASRAQEMLLSYQLDHVGYVSFLYQWLLDNCRYGLGIVSCNWDIETHIQTISRQLIMPGPMGQPIPIPVKQRQPVTGYEGNVLDHVDPFLWRPDNRWPVQQFQRGTWCGEEMWRSLYELKRLQAQGVYANVDEIPKYTAEHVRKNMSDRDRIMQAHRYYGIGYNDPSDALVLLRQVEMDLVPTDYGLGDGQEIERWIITTANNAVIVRADPFPFDHGKFTYAITESSPDIHSLVNPGLVEIMEPVHQHITWMINSMLENARKSLNDRLVVDPSILNMDDVMNPSAGKVIRVAREYWGLPGAVQNGIMQLKVDDISRQYMGHVSFLIDLLQRVSAASETIQGVPTAEEKTATEVSSVAQQGAQRLRTMARLFSATGLVPLARMMVQNNMQLMSTPVYMKIIGGMEQWLQGMGRAVQGDGVTITPEDIQGLFTFPIADAASPLDPVRFARTWVQIMQMAFQNPAVVQQVNHPAIFLETLRAMGIQDPTRFLIPQQVQVMPDQLIQQQVQQGNLVPQQMPGGAPPMRNPIPAQQQPQSVRGQENRPM